MKERKHGYYWVRSKKNKAWTIAYWWPNLNKGKGAWDFPFLITGVVGNVLDRISPNPLKPPEDEPPITHKAKRVRTKRVRTK